MVNDKKRKEIYTEEQHRKPKYGPTTPWQPPRNAAATTWWLLLHGKHPFFLLKMKK